MRTIDVPLVMLAILLALPARAHHSFAMYDIDNRIQRTGVLTKLVFSSPHIVLELEVERADGGREVWSIESMSPSRWDSFGFPRDLARPGETVTLLGWPARNGDDAMLLSTLVTERGTTVLIDEVLQRRAHEDLPGVTIRRE